MWPDPRRHAVHVDGGRSPGTDCLRYRTQWQTDVEDYRPQVVVLVANAWDLLDRNVDGATLKFGTRGWDRLYRAELDSVLASSPGAAHTWIW